MPCSSVIRRLLPFSVAALLACQEAGDPALEPASGKAPSGPTVTATSPDTAVQDTTLDVQVSGSGFDAGSTAEWLLAGVPDARVHTNSTRYVSRSTLVANITIAKDAVPASYDVAVTTSNGKKGIGTELFVVQLRDPTAIVEVTDGGMAVTSDGRGPYIGDDCGVGARIYVANGSGDMVFNPYQTSPTTSPLCGGAPRVLGINLGALGVQTVTATNVADVYHLLAPNSRLQDLGFGLVNWKVCQRVKYNAEVGGQALVTATGFDAFGRRTWVAESQAPHYAGCYKSSKGSLVWDGIRRVVPFRMTITEVLPQ